MLSHVLHYAYAIKLAAKAHKVHMVLNMKLKFAKSLSHKILWRSFILFSKQRPSKSASLTLRSFLNMHEMLKSILKKISFFCRILGSQHILSYIIVTNTCIYCTVYAILNKLRSKLIWIRFCSILKQTCSFEHILFLL